jgi:hypothetical protein
MSYKLAFISTPTYLHAVVTGLNDRENVMRYLGDIQRECAACGFSRVLIEERLEGPRLDVVDVFKIVTEGSSRAMGIFTAVAYVDVNAEGELMEFAETLAVYRSFPVRVFSTVDEARKWLLGADGGDSPPPGR